ncbi:sigma 54-interacting transcriptional regulator [Alteribacillus sp. YIM 98480]|uniref:sigma 54-interacting transcriptional regulator n=1 Tax=Alteribacillus sp. YIM 98480 TaxID=2606599 RepID=UPI00131CC7E7|nr:sigma 54-interacting transcriptional regulator [Alteribacillus sp. YIM 98480]
MEEANGGTLFLDEIGELPLSLQPKLLQLLQDKMYLPLGDTVPRSADVRILAATNRDLGAMVTKREFREDLYYRLNVVSIRVPPLRERREDIIPFLSHYMQYYNQKYDRSATLTNEAIDTLQSYDWPGNIRELENMVERMVITSTSDVILKSALPEKILSREPFHDPAFSISRNQSLPLYLENIERQAIKKALKEKGSTRKAAADLGMTQSALMRRIKKYNIHPK